MTPRTRASTIVAALPLDPARSFAPGDDREDMAHFLRTAGYLFVRGVFGADEVAGFLAEAEALRAEAVPGDKLSWWGKRGGEAVLCRVTRAGAKPGLRSIPADPRLRALVDLADEPLEHRVQGRRRRGRLGDLEAAWRSTRASPTSPGTATAAWAGTRSCVRC